MTLTYRFLVLVLLSVLLTAAPATALAATTRPSAEAAPTSTSAPAAAAMTTPAPAVVAAPAALYHVLPATRPGTAVIGDNDRGLRKSPYHIQAKLVPNGAGLRWGTLTDYTFKPRGADRYAVLEYLPTAEPPVFPPEQLYPMGARAIWVNGQAIDLLWMPWNLDATPGMPGNPGIPATGSSATYSLTIAAPGFATKSIEAISTAKDVNLGDIALTK
jgi:hypothetical protein